MSQIFVQTEWPLSTPLPSLLPAHLGSCAIRACIALAGILAFGAFSLPLYAQGAPAKPSKPTLTIGGSFPVPRLDYVTIEWTAPSDNGSAITSYDVSNRISATGDTWHTTRFTGGLSDPPSTFLTSPGGENVWEIGLEVRVRAVNAHGEGPWSDIEEFNSPALSSGVSDQSWAEDVAVSVTLPTASGGESPLTYSLGGELPTGVSFSGTTRVLSGTPTAASSAATYTYFATGSNGHFDAETFTIAVLGLSGPGDQSWVKGSAVSVTLPAAIGGDAPLTYSLAGTPPTGVSFNTSTRVLSGTPSATQTATSYTYKVRDANGTEQSVSFTIAVLGLSGPGDQSWVKGSAVSVTLPAAIGGDAPLTYTLTGTLPTGVSFDDDDNGKQTRAPPAGGHKVATRRSPTRWVKSNADAAHLLGATCPRA